MLPIAGHLRIKNEIEYPRHMKVAVIRETRAVDDPK